MLHIVCCDGRKRIKMKTMTENIAGACIITRTLLNNPNTVEPRGTETSLIRTPLYYGQFSMSRQNSHIFSFHNTDSLLYGQGTLNLGPREQIHINLTSLLRTLLWSGESQIPIWWICTGWIPSGWWAMQGDFKSSVAVYQITRCERCTEEHNRLLKAWITTDSIKIFSITFCTLFTV